VQGREVVEIWGSGSPLREFLHVDDLADACTFLMQHYSGDDHINVGTGIDVSIRTLAEMVAEVVHPGAQLCFDSSKPDGTPRKLLNVDRLEELGWRATVPLGEGIRSTYAWYLAQLESGGGGLRGVSAVAAGG